jgi:hypothetical protein
MREAKLLMRPAAKRAKGQNNRVRRFFSKAKGSVVANRDEATLLKRDDDATFIQ